MLGHLIRRHPVPVALVAAFLLVAAFGHSLAPKSMTQTDLSASLLGPSGEHLLGTDSLGRDVLSRLLGSAQVAAEAFFIVVLIGGVAGTAMGTLAGGIGGLPDMVISRIIDAVQGFPTILVAIVIVAL